MSENNQKLNSAYFNSAIPSFEGMLKEFTQALVAMEMRWIDREEKEKKRKDDNYKQVLTLLKDSVTQLVSTLPSIIPGLRLHVPNIDLNAFKESFNNAGKGIREDNHNENEETIANVE